ncbi:hypothetical protein CUJ83_01045 [Methanocella sp. CWC-04]|uniref:Uncharacterized protein n=1 Tax=Methanooceanicella nereidis TaxID=2052831 RepID=A0AAP2R9V6_9EURY|nr:hypothetical protein [Methanocella sp. CWC-04]MCD1293583.1 hypothetical protein [Methanocella sp. CWC-04]
MDIKFSWWSAVIGLMLLLMILSVIGIVQVNTMDIFWIVVTVACIWAIMRLFFPKDRPQKPGK